MRNPTLSLVIVLLCLSSAAAQAQGTSPVQVYGAWHCGNDACTWSTVRTPTDFDTKNRWLIDRGDGRPSVNLVILSFVHPLKLLQLTNDAQTVNGLPRGMTQDVVNYFKTHGIRVMLSIGGITYVKPWNQALASQSDAWQLGLNAADAATRLGVGIEIDYEEDRSPNLAGLQSFISAYRSIHPYDPTGADQTARLTIDLAAGDRWLVGLAAKASTDWLDPRVPVLDYANAMVPARQTTASGNQANWQEHVDGKPRYSPPIPPLAPAKFTGSLWLVASKPLAECTNFAQSLQKATGPFVQGVAPNPQGPGSTTGMLGFMFWAAECEGTRTVCTTPPNSCQGGVGVGATTYDVPIPMPALRQQ